MTFAPQLAAALLLALTWSPFVSRQTDPAGIFSVTPWLLWMPVACLLIAGLVGGWTGLAVIYVAICGLVAGTETAGWTAVYFAVGVLALEMVRLAPRDVIRWGLLASATLEIGVSLWPSGWTSGSFAHPQFQGAMIAAVLPLAPWWALPVLGMGLLWSHSYLAGIAALAGMLVAHTRHWPLFLAVAATAVLVYAFLGFKSLDSTRSRAFTWQAGIFDMTPRSWIFGHGPGGWAIRMWNLWCPCPPGEVFWAAHNEYLQWVYETGAAGLALLVLWMRQSVSFARQSPPMWHGAAVAVMVLCSGLQVFHLPTLAPVMILVLGGALHLPPTGAVQ